MTRRRIDSRRMDIDGVLVSAETAIPRADRGKPNELIADLVGALG